MRRFWNETEDNILKTQWADPYKPVKEIAESLGRDTNGVFSRASKLKLAPRGKIVKFRKKIAR